jgi:histone H3/H4
VTDLKKKGLTVIRVDDLEEERLLFSIITSRISKKAKQKIYEAIEEFMEKRSI